MPSVSLPTVMMAATAAGAVTSAAGAMEQGAAGQAAANYQAAVAANNAKIANQNAAWDIQSGEIQAANRGLRARAQVGAQKASQGAGGVDVNTGSASDVRAGTAEMGMLDALTIRSNAARQAYSAEVQGVSDTAQSQLDIMQGEQSEKAGDIGAATSLLNGVSTVGSKYALWQKQFGASGGGAAGDPLGGIPEG